ncbi:arylamine N-acetyltransferase [Kitasatospora atroaurantiaca]|uniref:Arylamine N-acetyltransferase n=1 Tax=Kitasatospora atroaurantiaca TaxID=285545 RepID=A0A561EZ75_9ACTN|nr:arylamine N-acetyltransferase [Kitasatospora atroaurantiaca]TWE20905.1 arylamine N-acetyltransferase [Kitasatospora atroaurantiaca]
MCRHVECHGGRPVSAAPRCARSRGAVGGGAARAARAHVERIPYETLEILLARPTTVSPQESIDRILRGRGGYCFHLNGAFATLLDALGYQVRWHVGGVQVDAATPAGANGNHLALTVDCEGEAWFVDVGLGEGLHEPLPLREGTYRQGPFTFGLVPSTAEPGGWRLDNDPQGGFPGMDFRPEPAGPADFTEQHDWLSTSPDSQFARFPCAFRRDADSIDALRGCVLVRTDGTGRYKRELTNSAEWFAVLRDTFGLALPDVGPAEREALWRRTAAAHLAWKEELPQHA